MHALTRSNLEAAIDWHDSVIKYHLEQHAKLNPQDKSEKVSQGDDNKEVVEGPRFNLRRERKDEDKVEDKVEEKAEEKVEEKVEDKGSEHQQIVALHTEVIKQLNDLLIAEAVISAIDEARDSVPKRA